MFAALLFAVALAASPSRADDLAWQKLQRGMSAKQVTQLVGVPLLRNAARGHEVWIYDAGANAQFHGGVLTAWSSPKSHTPPAAGPKPSAPAGAP